MIKNIKLLLVSMGISLFFFGLSPLPAYAGTAGQQIKDGVNIAAGEDDPGSVNLTTTIEKIVNVISVIVGAIAVIMLIFGGFRYITSAGNDAGVQAARNTILYAIIGLVIVGLAQVIVKFVIRNIA